MALGGSDTTGLRSLLSEMNSRDYLKGAVEGIDSGSLNSFTLLVSVPCMHHVRKTTPFSGILT